MNVAPRYTLSESALVNCPSSRGRRLEGSELIPRCRLLDAQAIHVDALGAFKLMTPDELAKLGGVDRLGTLQASAVSQQVTRFLIVQG